MKSIKVNVTPTVEEYIQFNKIINRGFMRKAWGICLIFIAILFVAVLNSDEKTLSVILGGFVGPVAIVVIVLGLLQYSIVFKSKKVFEHNEYLREEKTYEFTNEYIITHSNSDDTKFGWNKISKIIDTESSLIIFISNFQGMLIPKSSLQNDEDLNVLSILIKEKVDKSKIKTIK